MTVNDVRQKVHRVREADVAAYITIGYLLIT
jgi:hypothetical protein